MKLFVTAAAFLVLAFGPTPAQAQQPMPEMQIFDQVELTEDSARRAIDAVILIEEKYDEETLQRLGELDPEDAEGQIPASIANDIRSFGFNEAGEWSTTVRSVGFAYMAIQDDNLAEMEAAIAEIEADTSMPEELRARMLAMFTSMIPSQNNIDVVTALTADPDYAAKLETIFSDE